MRKLVVQQWATVDNIVAEEDGGLSFVNVPSGAEMPDDAFKASVMDFIASVDTMIIGANTYAMAKDYWPHATDQGEFGERFNRLAKIVASTRLRHAPWGDFPPATITSDPVATIRDLRQQEGRNIMLWGSLTLMQALFDAGLVDEVYLRIVPVTRGRGRRLFADPRTLRLIEARPFDNGIVMQRYAVEGAA